MRRIGFDECDTTEEIVGHFNKIFENQAQMEGKIVQNAQAIEALKPKKKEAKKEIPLPALKVEVKPKSKKKGKSKMKSKGFALTRVLAALMLLMAITGLCYAYVPSDINYEIASNPEMLSVYLRDVTSNMASDSYLFTPRAIAPRAIEGRIYYDSGSDSWKGYIDPGGWTTLAVAAGTSLDAAYTLGATITADNGAVIINNTDTDANPTLTVTSSGADAAGHAIFVNVSGAAKEGISITNTGTGSDIEGHGA
ncbi:unnamed protein product, partial [marine sediment metagenome]